MEGIVSGCFGENGYNWIVWDVCVGWFENVWEVVVIIGDSGNWGWVWNVGCFIFVNNLISEDGEDVVVGWFEINVVFVIWNDWSVGIERVCVGEVLMDDLWGDEFVNDVVSV